MIKKPFLLRLVLDFIAAGLLFVALAYYWLDNTAHEVIGTGLFVLLMAHNVFNRRWYGAIAKARHVPRSLIDGVFTLGLLVAMLALLVTSVVISRTVFSFLALDGGFGVRQMHALAAYWSLVFVSIHLGLRWQKVMNAVRSALNVVGTSTARTAALRLVAAALALHGLQASFAMGVGAKLTLQMSLDGWDFEASALGFFLNWLSIVGLYAVLTHYVASWLQHSKRKALPSAGVAKT